MTKEELEKEAEEHCNEVLCSVCEKVTCTKKIKCREWRDRRAGYYCGAEPRENQIADIKANCDLAIEGRDVKIRELELELTVEKDQHQEEINLHLHAEDYIKSLEKENKTLEGCLLAEQEHTQMLEQQIEKMKCCPNCDFIFRDGNCYYDKECKNKDHWKLRR